jgi:hypothetical protein
VSYEKGEIVYQGTNLNSANAVGIVAEFDRVNLILRLRNIKGIFALPPNGSTHNYIKGNTSGAQFDIDHYDGMENATTNLEDNSYLETQAADILDFSETNPFGEP